MRIVDRTHAKLPPLAAINVAGDERMARASSRVLPPALSPGSRPANADV